MKQVANFLSIVFQPLLLPVYALLLYVSIDHYTTEIIRSEENSRIFYMFLLFTFLLTVVIPMGSMFIMKRSRIISSLQLPDRKERIPVMLLVFIYYLFTYYLYRSANDNNYQVFGAFISFLAGGLALSFLSLLITFKWKISLHAIGISGLCGAFLALNERLYPVVNAEEIRWMNISLFLLLGLVSTSRLVLKAHNFYQVIAGMVLGGTIEYIFVLNDITF